MVMPCVCLCRCEFPVCMNVSGTCLCAHEDSLPPSHVGVAPGTRAKKPVMRWDQGPAWDRPQAQHPPPPTPGPASGSRTRSTLFLITSQRAGKGTKRAHRDPGGGKTGGGWAMDVALNPDSDTSWLCHLQRVTSPLWAGVSCLDHVGGLTYPVEKSERSPTYGVQPRPSININFLPSVARTTVCAGGWVGLRNQTDPGTCGLSRPAERHLRDSGLKTSFVS